MHLVVIMATYYRGGRAIRGDNVVCQLSDAARVRRYLKGNTQGSESKAEVRMGPCGVRIVCAGDIPEA